MYGIKGQITLNETQQQFVMQNIGNARFVWNQLLETWNNRYENNQITKLDLDLIEKLAATLHHTSSAYLLGMTDNSHYTPKFKASKLFSGDGRTNVIVKNDEMAPEIPKGACVQIRDLKLNEELTGGSFYYIEFIIIRSVFEWLLLILLKG